MRTPRVSPKTDKILLIVNIVLFIGAVVIAVIDLYYHEYISSVAMLAVMIVTTFNSYGSWRRLKGKV
jgi:membrane protein YdbS with pleckstrin-like domain